MLLTHVYATNLILSRSISFAIAVLITWYLNRTKVFVSEVDAALNKGVECGRYLAVQIVGSLINLFVFMLIISVYPFMKTIPMIPLFVGAFFGLIINFTGARYWVYKTNMIKEPYA